MCRRSGGGNSCSSSKNILGGDEKGKLVDVWRRGEDEDAEIIREGECEKKRGTSITAHQIS
jgi:hypothetical protein